MHPDNAGRPKGQDQSYSDDAPVRESETSNLCMEQCQIGENAERQGNGPFRHTPG